MNLEPAMQQMFSNLGATTLYRVVSVLQAPFVMKDENGKRIPKVLQLRDHMSWLNIFWDFYK